MKCLNKFIFSVVFLLFIIPFSADATSGACSYHSGVDCDMGYQSNGKVYCNDGWTDSTTYYEFTTKCQSNVNADDIIYDQLYYDGKIVNAYQKEIDYNEEYQKCMSWTSNQRYIDKMNSCANYANNEIIISSTTYYCPANSTPKYDYSNLGSIKYCKCDDGYYNYDTGSVKIINGQCKKGEPFIDAIIYIEKASDKFNDQINKINRTNYLCNLRYGNSFLGNSGDCECKIGYRWIYAAYEKIIACVKRNDYDEVVKNNITEGSLVRAEGSVDIYIVKYIGAKKFKRLILSPSVFNNYGHLRWENVMDVSQATLNSFTTSDLVRAVNDDKIYRLYPQGDIGQKRLVKNTSVITRLGLDADSIYEINSFDRESYTTGAILE